MVADEHPAGVDPVAEARIWFDQYVPRSGTELSPSGWFARSAD